jgi:nucleotide-binding universal stress UspA family protein
MKKILYPTDFSETAENAFLYALQVADTLGASVITLHAFDRPDISNFNLPGVLREVYDSIDLDEFENYEDEVPLLRDIATDNGYYHIPMVHVLEEGAPVSAILRTANKNKADLSSWGLREPVKWKIFSLALFPVKYWKKRIALFSSCRQRPSLTA